MTLQSLLFCTALWLCASAAFGQGTYQRTKDGRTTVWNDHPKSGDVATWAGGGRDREGYATGFGTLTWYRERHEKSVIYARYFGNMVRGKFEGPVNAHSKGKTAHAFFTEGARTSPWAMGPAPSRGVGGERVEPAKPAAAVAAEPETVERPIPKAQPPKAEAAAAAPSATPSTVVKKREEPVRDKADTKPAPPAAQPSPSAPLVAEKQAEPVREKVESEPPTTPAPVPTASPTATRSPRRPIPIPKPARNGKPKPGVDDSLRALVGPPSSLRATPAPAPSAEGNPPTPSSPPTNPPLSREEVIDLADTVARTHGYDLGEYKRPEAQYHEEADTWSLFYDQKPTDGLPEPGKHFNITVDNKTKKAAILPGE